MDTLKALVSQYAHADLNQVLINVGLTGIPEKRHEELKEATLAQWLLESGRATSKLSQEANNFSGLKWRSEMVGFATPIKIKVPSEPIPVEFCEFSSIDSFLTGYWKFLTRSPYVGLQDHTNSPANFIGFLRRKGFAADLSYVSKVLSLLTEARGLLSEALNVTIPAAPTTLQAIRFPHEVEVGQGFLIEGTTSPTHHGKTLLITVDGMFPSSGAVIDADGKWRLNFVLNQAGDRHIRIGIGTESDEITIKAVVPVDDADPEETPNPSGAVQIELTGSVGLGGVNRASDVRAVKKRLHGLGYTWIGNPDSSSINTGFIQAIRLFQSVIAGQSQVAGDGRVDIGGPTHRWLQAANAPQWTVMPDSDPAINFFNWELQRTNDNHDFGTHWLAGAILAIAKEYHASSPSSAPFAINNVSIPKGGDTPAHSGHETGLMCDVLLPRTDGDFGGITWSQSLFDRSATRALLKAIRRQKLVRTVLFNDPTLRSERFLGSQLCHFATGHDNHIHFEINPPVRT